MKWGGRDRHVPSKQWKLNHLPFPPSNLRKAKIVKPRGMMASEEWKQRERDGLNWCVVWGSGGRRRAGGDSMAAHLGGRTGGESRAAWQRWFISTPLVLFLFFRNSYRQNRTFKICLSPRRSRKTFWGSGSVNSLPWREPWKKRCPVMTRRWRSWRSSMTPSCRPCGRAWRKLPRWADPAGQSNHSGSWDGAGDASLGTGDSTGPPLPHQRQLSSFLFIKEWKSVSSDRGNGACSQTLRSTVPLLAVLSL